MLSVVPEGARGPLWLFGLCAASVMAHYKTNTECSFRLFVQESSDFFRLVKTGSTNVGIL